MSLTVRLDTTKSWMFGYGEGDRQYKPLFPTNGHFIHLPVKADKMEMLHGSSLPKSQLSLAYWLDVTTKM